MNKGEVLTCGFHADQQDTPGTQIERWRNAQATIQHYPQGDNYASGRRLLIEGEQVMDTCEFPWAQETVNELLGSNDHSQPIQTLERGYGLGITAGLILKHMLFNPYGGVMDVIELNEDVLRNARDWANRVRRYLQRMSEVSPETTPPITIRIIPGDAYQQTQSLIQKKGQRYDAILSDTYPFTQEHAGRNDLEDLAILKQGLKPNGRFSFFAYYPNTRSGLAPEQRDIINLHFSEYHVKEVAVFPPPSYTYLHQDGQPISHLPVVTCWNPKIAA